MLTIKSGTERYNIIPQLGRNFMELKFEFANTLYETDREKERVKTSVYRYRERVKTLGFSLWVGGVLAPK